MCVVLLNGFMIISRNTKLPILLLYFVVSFVVFMIYWNDIGTYFRASSVWLICRGR